MPHNFPEQQRYELCPARDPAGLWAWDTGRPGRGLRESSGRTVLPMLNVPPNAGDVVVPIFALYAVEPTDRLHLMYCNIQPGDASVAPTNPTVLRVQIRQGFDYNATVVTTVDVVAQRFGDADSILQVSGRLCNQWEVWAVALPPNAGPAYPLDVHFRAQLDRVGGGTVTVQLGPGATVVPP